MKIATVVVLAGALLLSACASETNYNGDINKLADAPDHGHVRIKGTVGEVYGRDGFILRDYSGSVEVFTPEHQFSVHQGEKVFVEGTIESSTFANILGERKDVMATNVEQIDF